jgi:TPR repeat protein
MIARFPFEPLIIGSTQHFVDKSNIERMAILLEFRSKFRKGNGAAKKDRLWRIAGEGHPEAIYLDTTCRLADEAILSDEEFHAKIILSASGGYPPAIFQLAASYFHGEVVPKAPDRANALLRAASILGHLAATAELGIELVYSKGPEAWSGLSLLSAAAGQRYRPAVEALSSMYEQGEFVQKDLMRSQQLRQLLQLVPSVDDCE